MINIIRLSVWNQYWTKVDYGDKFVDAEGQRAFILINKATDHALSHGQEIGAAVRSIC